ncbi:MAG: molybdopterin cofactor-binding domain-containing protein, partial [Micromonosporaceae bacterium]
VFGLGQALMEELRYDSGEPMDTNLSDYQIPSIMDAPYVTSTVLENSRPDAEPHGIGESTVPPMAPAIANAVCAATGARVRDLPLTAEKLLRALREAQPAQPDADRPAQPGDADRPDQPLRSV